MALYHDEFLSMMRGWTQRREKGDGFQKRREKGERVSKRREKGDGITKGEGRLNRKMKGERKLSDNLKIKPIILLIILLSTALQVWGEWP